MLKKYNMSDPVFSPGSDPDKLYLNPECIFVGGGKIHHVSVLTSLLVKTLSICHNSIKQGNLFLKAVLLLREHGHFSQNFASHGVNFFVPSFQYTVS